MSTMKPWEEEWKASSLTFVDTVDGRGVLSISPSPVTRIKKVQTFVVAAPKMARALITLLGDGPRKHLSLCHALMSDRRPCHPECSAIREALAAAGVPLDDP